MHARIPAKVKAKEKIMAKIDHSSQESLIVAINATPHSIYREN